MVLVSKKSKTSPIHHRKRHGGHHKRTKQYEKSYWPYLPLLAIVGLVFAFNVLWTPLSHSVLGYATNTSPIGLLEATNGQRSQNGLAGLQINSQLNNAAQSKANDMVSRNYWSHTTPDGAEPWTFVSGAGYQYLTVGENLAYGFDSSGTTVTGWMNSPGHRANILNNNFQEVGFGIANAADYQGQGPQTIVVAFYGKSASQPVAASTPPATPSTPAATPATTTPSVATGQPAPAAQGTPAQNQAAPTAPDNPVAAPADSDKIVMSATVLGPPQRVTRLQATSTNAPNWSVLTTILIIAAATALFLFRHLGFLHRALVKGEQYIIKHPVLDLVAVAVIALGALLTRTAGFIQ